MGMCAICGKKRMRGNHVSHANNRDKRSFYPNLQRVRVAKDKHSERILVCTRCIRSGKVVKAIKV